MVLSFWVQCCLHGSGLMNVRDNPLANGCLRTLFNLLHGSGRPFSQILGRPFAARFVPQCMGSTQKPKRRKKKQKQKQKKKKKHKKKKKKKKKKQTKKISTIIRTIRRRSRRRRRQRRRHVFVFLGRLFYYQLQGRPSHGVFPLASKRRCFGSGGGPGAGHGCGACRAATGPEPAPGGAEAGGARVGGIKNRRWGFP